MRYTHHPIDGVAITLDDLRIFLDEMTGYRGLTGTAVVRGQGHIEFDMACGPRLRAISVDTEDGGPGQKAEQPQKTESESRS